MQNGLFIVQSRQYNTVCINLYKKERIKVKVQGSLGQMGGGFIVQSWWGQRGES